MQAEPDNFAEIIAYFSFESAVEEWEREWQQQWIIYFQYTWFT